MAEEIINPIDFEPERPAPQIDLAPPTDAPEPIDLAPIVPTTNTYQMPSGALPKRAFKAAYGLAGTPAAKPVEAFLQSLGLGNEEDERKEAATKLNESLSLQRTDKIAEALTSRNLTADDLDSINRVYNRYYDPSSVFEQNYSRNYINALDAYATKLGDDHFWNTTSQEHPSTLAAAREWGTISMAQRQVAETLLEGVNAKIEKSRGLFEGEPGGHYVTSALDIAKIMVIPGYEEYYMRGQVPEVGFWQGLLKNENLERQRNYLRNLPFDQYTQRLTEITNRLSEFNPHLAANFLRAMIGQSRMDSFLNGMDTFVNAAFFGAPLAKYGVTLAKRAYSPAFPEVEQVTNAMKDVLKSADGEPRPQNITAAAGDLQASGVTQATENLTNALKGASQAEREAIEALPAHLRADRIDEKANPGILNTTQANIIEADSRAFERSSMDALANTLRPQRIPIESFSREVVDNILQEQKARYPGLSNSIIRITDPIYDPYSNTYSTNQWIGRSGGILFASKNEGNQYARANGFSVAQVKRYPQSGLGFAIEAKGVNIDETGSVIRDNIVTPARAESISPSLREEDALLSRHIPFLDYIRSPEDTLSAEQRRIRKAATYPQAEMRRVAVEEAEIIRDLARGIQRFDSYGEPLAIPRYFPGISGLVNKRKWNDFKRMLDLARKTPDPVTERMGYFASNPHELQDMYLLHIGRIPTFEEQRAYFANKRLVEYDRMLRTVSMYRNKARVGAENFQIISNGPKATGIGHNGGPALEDVAGEIRSIPFDGVVRNYLPSKGNILIMGDDTLSSRVHSLDHAHPKTKEKWEDLVTSGKATLIEAYDPESRPFNGFVDGGNKHVRYVLVKNFERNPLSWSDQVNRVGGGHFNWEYKHYIKQANVVREEVGDAVTFRYEGDNTVIPVLSRAEGAHFNKLLNDIRLLLKDGKMDEAAELGKKLPPPYPYKDFKAGFYESRSKDGKAVPPRFNFDEPFTVVPHNKAIIEMDGKLKQRYPENNWRDGTREGLARNFQVEYTRERDSYELFGPVVNKGTKANPEWNIEPGRMADPIVTANRALNRIIHSTFMEDYKASAVESWLREAEPHLDVKPSELRSSPYHYFYNPEFLSGTEANVKYPLLSNRFKIRQMTGLPNRLESYLYSTTQALYDAAYTKPKGVGGAIATGVGKALTVIDPIWQVNWIKDPVRVLKTMTFDMLMGMFSPVQFLVQQMTWVNIGAVSPRSMPAAVMASLFQQWSRYNRTPEMIKQFDEIAVKMGTYFPGMRKFKPGEFTEAFNLLNRSGFGIVGGEFSMLDNNRVANIIQNGKDRFLDWSRFFFKEGERSPRYGAHFTAYLEYREKFPTKKITRGEAAKILDRADFLYNNMSVASHSALHTGVAALMTQFFAYQIRLAEVLSSKRLAGGLGETKAERNLTRARLLVTNAAMFGIPGSIGMTMLPIGDWIRGKAIENKYQPGQMALLDIAMNGLPAWAASMATGTLYNFGGRYGQQGPTFLKDMVNGDTNSWRVFGGASANVLLNTFGPNKEGLVDAMMAIARGDYDTYPPKLQDVLNFAKEIRSVSATEQLVIALNTGEWVNRNKDFIENISAREAWFRFITGLKSQAEADMWPMGDITEAQDRVEREALKRFRSEMNLSLMAHANNDPQARDDHWSRGIAPLVAAKMDSERINEELAKIYRLNESLIDRTNYRFFVPKAPSDRRREYLDIYQNIPQKGTR